MSTGTNAIPTSVPVIDENPVTEAPDQPSTGTVADRWRAGSFEDELGSLTDDALASVLDHHRHDRDIHRRLIALDKLPVGIAERLLRLVSLPALREQLIIKHSLSADSARTLHRIGRQRPGWWRQHFLNAIR